jgi:CHAT domain-containing protein/tetratricopeptide (TPR) repeat protein
MRTAVPIAVACALLAAGCRRAPDASLVVVESAPAGAGHRAGVQPGDVLTSWERVGESGPLSSPFALARIEIEQAPMGEVTIHGRRGWRDRSWTVPAGSWEIEVRPQLASADAATFDRARGAKGDSPSAAREWQSLAERLQEDARAWAAVQSGRAWLAARQPEAAARAFAAARSALADRPLDQAMAAEQEADAMRASGALADAALAAQRALDLRAAASARSLVVAQSRFQLARLARRRNDVALAASHLSVARELREALAPDSPALALVWHEVGAIAFARGQLGEAEAAYGRARDIQQRRLPDSLDLANTLSALGSVSSQRSDFAQAEALHRQALALTTRLAPNGVEHAYVLNRLGVVAREQGDLEEAETDHRRALEVFERAVPESVEVAGSLNNLGLVAQARRDWAAAEGFHRRALAIRERLNPQGGDVAASLNNLGAVAREREDFVAAERYLRRSLEMKRTLSPDSLTLGASLHNLGEALLGQRRLDEARACFSEALAIRGRIAPGSGDEATDWHSLGLVDREQGRTGAALAKWRRALDIMDAQRGKLALGDRAGFTARYAVMYQDPIELLLSLGRPAEAFAVRERLHARAMLSLLGQREQAPVEPRPLDLARARGALDPGVTLVAYVVLRRTTAAFVVRGPGVAGPAVSAFVIPLDAEALRDRVVGFRGLIERGREAGEVEPALIAQGERLYAELLKPAGRALDDAERILVSPDGALHLLPFGALVRQRAPLMFLAEWKPLPTVASASVYAEIKRTRRATADPAPRLAAFGDPSPGAGAASGEAGSREGRDALRPLPYSREEVERVAALFGDGARRYLGAAATKAEVLALGRDVRYVHFATHGLLDARSPLDSALVMAPGSPGQPGSDGLLRAWEVRDRLRLDADLVALSACESGLGREATAEGLIGLSRAFQHAGARSVLASLWAISDRSTARFMESFYERLRRGAPRDLALQEAQVASLRQGAHPYHWAAFQLSGDWR